MASSDSGPSLVPDELHPQNVDTTSTVAHRGRLWVSSLVFGLFAGLLTWVVGEMTVDWFPPELREVEVAMGNKSMLPTRETRNASEAQTGTLAAGVLGAALGLSLGAAGGCARRSARAAVAAGVLGMVLGAAAGAGATRAVLRPYFEAHKEIGDAIVPSLLVLGAIWAAVGAVAGVAVALGLGDRKRAPRALIGGIAGAWLGAAVYQFGGAVFFALDATTQLVSLSWGSRLLAQLCACLSVSTGIVLALEPAKQRTADRRAENETANAGA